MARSDRCGESPIPISNVERGACVGTLDVQNQVPGWVDLPQRHSLAPPAIEMADLLYTDRRGIDTSGTFLYNPIDDATQEQGEWG